MIVLMIDETINEPTPVKPPKYKFRLIKAPKCKKFALEFSKSNPCKARAKMFTRVSESFLIECEVALKNHIMAKIKSHPSKGKTLT